MRALLAAALFALATVFLFVVLALVALMPAHADNQNLLTATVLVCTANSACTPATARQVVRVPGEQALPTTCWLEGEKQYGATSLARDLGADEIVRVICR